MGGSLTDYRGSVKKERGEARPCNQFISSPVFSSSMPVFLSNVIKVAQQKLFSLPLAQLCPDCTILTGPSIIPFLTPRL
jgi:hypothetical protein